MADNGCGRGGRGALLLAALKNQPRRPGQTSPSNESPESEPKVIGRGALLKSLISQGRGRAVVPTPETNVVPTFGRGRGLALRLGSSGSSSQSSSTSPPESTVPPPSEEVKPSQSPPVTELEKLAISKSYSGTSGTPLNLEVNYIRLLVKEGQGIYEYHVSFEPMVDSQRMKFKLMSDPAVKEVIGNVKTFDGSKLYIPLRLSSVTNITVHLPTDQSPVTITIKSIRKCTAQDCLHLYNILFKKVMNVLKMTRVGRNFFDPRGGISVPQHKLEIWPGYVTAVQEFEGGVMLNCDASFRVLRTTTALDMMKESTRQKGQNMQDHVTKTLIGCVVLTRYNNKTYKVDDIAWHMNPEHTFTSHKQEEVSFVDYYKKSYDIDIKDLRQPLLINKEKRKAGRGEEEAEPKLICLVPELCFMTGLTDEMRDDFRVMKDVASHTRITPENRQLALKRFVENVNNNPEAKRCFDNWNLVLETTPLSLEGRLLKSEVIQFGRGRQVPVNQEADWGRDVVNNPVLVPVNFENWACIYPQRDGNKVREFINMIQNVSSKMGINVRPPQIVEIKNDRTEAYCAALKEIINPRLQFVVAIFPTPRDDRYSAVKKLCCIEMPIPSQAINLKTISDQRKLRSVVQKIALQINCKLGGELWSVAIPVTDLMVCGLDTYHDAARGRRSVLAFVASINANRTRWFSMTTIQNQGQEVGDSLKSLVMTALQKYFEVNHKLPEKIILYRDGVGDGQMEFVSKYEVEQISSAFKHFKDGYSPSLSVVVVQKRINTRLFAVEGGAGRKMLKNPAPGAILDHSVTRKNWYDFFLVSQHVRQGTVTPTHYVVVYDSSSLIPEYMQRITFKMTHLYYNWPGTVRVPAPCQYAHKLAYLVGQNLHKETHAGLSDRLFYL